MSAVKWNSNDLIVRNEECESDIHGLVSAARSGERVRVEIERSTPPALLGHANQSQALFREGCVKAVEERIWPLAQRSGILAEIHRRLDDISESACSAAERAQGLASIYDFVGAWSLAARLMRIGLHVSVIEGAVPGNSIRQSRERAEVEIVIPIGLSTCV
jgi:hypothetical protein